MAVSFEEIEPPTFSISEKGEFHGRRTFLVDFLDTGQALLELYGGWNIVGGSAFLYPPANFPGIAGCFVIGAEAVGWPEDSPQATTLTSFTSAVTRYPKARITANYGPLPDLASSTPGLSAPAVPDGTFLRVSGQTSAEFVTVPGTSLRWDSDNESLAEDTDVGIWLGSTEIQTTWLRVPLPPWTAMRTHAGCVNDAEFMGYAAETVLFPGSAFDREFSINAQTLWTIPYTFKVRSQPWNYAYRPTVGWERYERDDGDPNYPLVDFDDLFEFE